MRSKTVPNIPCIPTALNKLRCLSTRFSKKPMSLLFSVYCVCRFHLSLFFFLRSLFFSDCFGCFSYFFLGCVRHVTRDESLGTSLKCDNQSVRKNDHFLPPGRATPALGIHAQAPAPRTQQGSRLGLDKLAAQQRADRLAALEAAVGGGKSASESARRHSHAGLSFDDGRDEDGDGGDDDDGWTKKKLKDKGENGRRVGGGSKESR